MKIFIDSADIDDIKQAYAWGVVDGITTNPSLLKKAVSARQKGLEMKEYIEHILDAAKDTPVSLEVTETTAAGMVAQAKKLYKMFHSSGKDIYIKIPINPALRPEDGTHFDGIAAIRALAKEKIPVNCTLIFTPEQALLAAKAGASLVSPFAGRIDDYLRQSVRARFQRDDYFPESGLRRGGDTVNDNGIVSGTDLVRQCVRILANYQLKAEVLAASMRNPRQVREAALAGAHIATLPFPVIRSMLMHYKTFEGVKNFTSDAAAVPEYRALTEEKKKEKKPGIRLPDIGKNIGISLDIRRAEPEEKGGKSEKK